MERELDLLLSDYEPLDWGVQRSLTQRDEEALRALGYAVGASRGDPFAPQLPDTRDRLRDLRMIDRVNAMMQQRRALLRQGTAGLARVAAIDAEAHALLEEIWQRNPGDPDVAPMLAATSRRRGDAARAVEIMRAMVVLRPTSATLQLGLARDYLALDRPDDALRSIARAVELEPAYLAAHGEAIAYYRGLRDPKGEAVWLRRLAVQLDVGSDARLAVERRLHRLTGPRAREVR